VRRVSTWRIDEYSYINLYMYIYWYCAIQYECVYFETSRMYMHASSRQLLGVSFRPVRPVQIVTVIRKLDARLSGQVRQESLTWRSAEDHTPKMGTQDPLTKPRSLPSFWLRLTIQPRRWMVVSQLQ
jgi:hypothetical protein